MFRRLWWHFQTLSVVFSKLVEHLFLNIRKWPLLEAAVLYLWTYFALRNCIILSYLRVYVILHQLSQEPVFVVCLEILCHIETSHLITNLNQLSGFNVITEIYDYDYNFYRKLFSNKLYLLGASFSNTHQKFIDFLASLISDHCKEVSKTVVRYHKDKNPWVEVGYLISPVKIL